jgi:hypothetical protein
MRRRRAGTNDNPYAHAYSHPNTYSYAVTTL